MNAPKTGNTDNSYADPIAGLFDIPEVDLDNQMTEMISGQGIPAENDDTTNISGTNATANDDGLDVALIDLLPFP